jgi:hypothetical protein
MINDITMQTHDFIIKIQASQKAKQELCSFLRMLGGYAIADELMPFVYAIGIQDKERLTTYLRDLSKDYGMKEPTLNEYEHRRTVSHSSRVLQLQVKGYGLLKPSELHPVERSKPVSRSSDTKNPFKFDPSMIQRR